MKIVFSRKGKWLDMDLWIRSQDKECLVKISNIQYVYKNYIHGLGTYYDNLKILGEYKTKERAIEILDEIKYLLETREVSQMVYNMPEK